MKKELRNKGIVIGIAIFVCVLIVTLIILLNGRTSYNDVYAVIGDMSDQSYGETSESLESEYSDFDSEVFQIPSLPNTIKSLEDICDDISSEMDARNLSGTVNCSLYSDRKDFTSIVSPDGSTLIIENDTVSWGIENYLGVFDHFTEKDFESDIWTVKRSSRGALGRHEFYILLNEDPELVVNISYRAAWTE